MYLLITFFHSRELQGLTGHVTEMVTIGAPRQRARFLAKAAKTKAARPVVDSTDEICIFDEFSFCSRVVALGDPLARIRFLA